MIVIVVFVFGVADFAHARQGEYEAEDARADAEKQESYILDDEGFQEIVVQDAVVFDDDFEAIEPASGNKTKK